MKTISKFLLFLSIAVMTSCATSNIQTTKYASTDLSEFKTFACYASTSSFKASEFKTESNKPIEESLVSLVNANMTVKGFSLNESEPDMVIFILDSNELKSGIENASVDAANSQGPNFSSGLGTQGYRRYSGQDSDAAVKDIPFTNGALVIEIFNRQSKELLWVGIAKDFKAHISDQTLVTRMVNGVFKNFPN